MVSQYSFSMVLGEITVPTNPRHLLSSLLRQENIFSQLDSWVSLAKKALEGISM